MKLLIAVLTFFPASVMAIKTTPEDFGIELQNKATAEVLVVVLPRAEDRIEYSYTARNSTSSAQDIAEFSVQVGTSISPSDASPPPRWFNGRCCIGDDQKKVFTWISEDRPFLIKPGAQLSGFKLTLKSIPTIMDYHVQGFTERDMAAAEDVSEEESEILSKLQDYFNNSFMGKTIGPSPVPAVIDLASLIDRLIAFKHQSVSLGWILGPGSDGIVKSLDAKLDAAKASVARGQNKTAENQLNAFVNELQAQRGKKINDNAFFLLKVNAEFIISKLRP